MQWTLKNTRGEKQATKVLLSHHPTDWNTWKSSITLKCYRGNLTQRVSFSLIGARHLSRRLKWTLWLKSRRRHNCPEGRTARPIELRLVQMLARPARHCDWPLGQTLNPDGVRVITSCWWAVWHECTNAQLPTTRKMLHACSPCNDFHSVGIWTTFLAVKASLNWWNPIIERIILFQTVSQVFPAHFTKSEEKCCHCF